MSEESEQSKRYWYERGKEDAGQRIAELEAALERQTQMTGHAQSDRAAAQRECRDLESRLAEVTRKRNEAREE